MDKEKVLKTFRELVAHQVATSRNPPAMSDRYIDSDARRQLIHLSDQEAEIALTLGVPIGLCSVREDYHGSHKGDYNFDLVQDMEEVEQLRRWSMYDERPAIYPYLLEPQELKGYIDVVLKMNTPQLRPDAPVVGGDQNIYTMLDIAGRSLEAAGMHAESEAMWERVTGGCYHLTLEIMKEYVSPIPVVLTQKKESGVNMEII